MTNRVFTRCVFCLSYEQMLQNHRFGSAFTRIPIFFVVQQKWKISYFLLDRNECWTEISYYLW